MLLQKSLHEMTELVNVTLENEMDLILAYKKAIRVAERLNLTISTQTTFATAVSEICRGIIEKTDTGMLSIGIMREEIRYSLAAQISFGEDIVYNSSDEGFLYAQKLLPHLGIRTINGRTAIELKIGLPRSSGLNTAKINILIHFFNEEEPYTPYEEIKRKNSHLSQIAEERDEELRQTKIINEQKTEFISIASHELKTPVTIIKAYAQLALSTSKGQCPPLIQSYLSKIEAQSSKLTFLIQQLLDVSKIESGKFDYRLERVDLDAYLQETLSQIKLSIPNHQLSWELNCPLNLKLDKLRIEQVLSNIIGNAAKYSSSESLIELKTYCNEDNHAIIAVSDKGIGISGGNLEKIFEKFFRDAEVIQKYSGLGMGLYISSKIIHGHGGRIWAESIPGKGATFCFSLPAES